MTSHAVICDLLVVGGGLAGVCAAVAAARNVAHVVLVQNRSVLGGYKDKFGVSWQVIPGALGRMLGDSNPARSQAVVQAMLKMRKIDIAGLQRAYDAA